MKKAFNLKVKNFGNEVQYIFYETFVNIQSDIKYNKESKIKYIDYLSSDEFEYFYLTGQLNNVITLNDRFKNDEFSQRQYMQYIEILEQNKIKKEKINNARSLRRTINKVYDYARSNKWEYFICLTFNPEIVNSYDYNECSKQITQYLNNLKKRYSENLKYIGVAEKHKSGRYHFHFMFSDIGKMPLVYSGRQEKKGKYYEKSYIDKFGTPIFNISNYKKGYSTASAIKDTHKASVYITKYLTKDMEMLKGKKKYWVSKNLNTPIITTYQIEESEKLRLLQNIDIKNKKIHKIDGTYKNIITYVETKKEIEIKGHKNELDNDLKTCYLLDDRDT